MDTALPQPSRYRIAVHRACEAYIASAAGFPGCECRGATAVEAIEHVRAALRAHFATARLLEGARPIVELEITA